MYVIEFFVQMPPAFVHLKINLSLVSKIKKIFVDGKSTEAIHLYTIRKEPRMTQEIGCSWHEK